MAGSLDDHHVEVIHSNEALLAILVLPTGDVKIQCKIKKEDGSPDHKWVAGVLRQIAEAEDTRAANPNLDDQP